MADLHVRRYDPGDAEAVWDLHVRALSAAGAFDEEFTHLDRDLKAVGEEYLAEGGEFLVGELDLGPGESPADDPEAAGDGDIVAMGAFQPHPEFDEAVVIRRMRVDPAYHRRGFGTVILDALESRAREREFTRVELDTTPQQEAAMAFYEAHGYEELRREELRDREMVYYEKYLE